MDRFVAGERMGGKPILEAALPRAHCPYYPPDVSAIPYIFSRTTMHQFDGMAKKYPKDRPIVLLVVNEGGLPLLANWLCVSAQHIATESVLVVVPPENGTHFVSTLTRKGITAIQTSFRWEYTKSVYIHIHAYIRTCLHNYTYVHTCIRTYTYIHTYVHTYIHTYVHTYMQTYIVTTSYLNACTQGIFYSM